jgi:hypothetical protein
MIVLCRTEISYWRWKNPRILDLSPCTQKMCTLFPWYTEFPVYFVSPDCQPEFPVYFVSPDCQPKKIGNWRKLNGNEWLQKSIPNAFWDLWLDTSTSLVFFGQKWSFSRCLHQGFFTTSQRFFIYQILGHDGTLSIRNFMLLEKIQKSQFWPSTVPISATH